MLRGYLGSNEDFDVFEQRRFGFSPGAELCSVNKLSLERAEK